jgi:hypothetical protein
MRKKMLFLALALTATASLTTPLTAATTYTSCPICTTYADGSQCCVSCICDSTGRIVACTDHYCPPEGGLN